MEISLSLSLIIFLCHRSFIVFLFFLFLSSSFVFVCRPSSNRTREEEAAKKKKKRTGEKTRLYCTQLLRTSVHAASSSSSSFFDFAQWNKLLHPASPPLQTRKSRSSQLISTQLFDRVLRTIHARVAQKPLLMNNKRPDCITINRRNLFKIKNKNNKNNN